MTKESKTVKSANPALAEAFAKRMHKEDDKKKDVANEAPTEEQLAPFIKRFGQDKIDEWKTIFAGRKLIYLKVEDSMAILRPPTSEDLGEYMMGIGTNGISKAIAFIVNELWLDGDIELIQDEDKFIGVFMQVNNLLEGKKAEFFRA